MIRFYSVPARVRRPPVDASYPCVVLTADDWDDYGYKTQWSFRYYQSADSPVPEETSVKILKYDMSTTKLSKRFTKLAPGSCSLGQSLDYYRSLAALGEKVYGPILDALNDVVYNPDLLAQFKNEVGFRTSLVRFSEAQSALEHAGPLVGQSRLASSFASTFTTQLAGARSPHVLDLDFRRDGTGLHRIIALIGRNGTGKTQVLAAIANAMSGQDPDAGTFAPVRPSFSRVIAVSYSAFDRFKRPKPSESFSYEYCGIRRGNAVMNREEIADSFIEAMRRIQSLDRMEAWAEAMTPLLRAAYPGQPRVKHAEFGSKVAFNRLSSGQRFLMLVFSRVVASLEPRSLVLFDEPELHLHPDGVSALARSFHTLLEKFDSYAVMSTHSPILVQEVPSRRVLVVGRENDVPSVRRLQIESFGENLSVITEEIFGMGEESHNYRLQLGRLIEQFGFDGTLERFAGRLSLNARGFMASAAAELDIRNELTQE